MKKPISFVLALVMFVSLFSFVSFASEVPAGSDGPGREPVSGETADVPESGEPGDPDESARPEGPGGFRGDRFSDVAESDWFFGNVKTAYELGLMQGRGENVFSPLGSLNLAEAITVAVRLRSAYTGDGRDFSGSTPWYASAVEYAVAQDIIREGDFTDYTAAATRAQVAYILSRALPSGALEEVNTAEDNSLPDVKMDDAYAANIYFLYRTGILSGADGNGTFYPSGTVTRAETAAIASRIATPSLRVTCEFYAPAAAPTPVYPDLSLKERADDSFFADAAFLGNSLVDGLRMYSKFKTADFYCATSMFVTTADTYISSMARKQYGKIYIELGINEIGGSVNTFIRNYRAMLDKIRALQPNADIYIMAITPTSRAKIGTSFDRNRVIMYNNALYQLAADWGCWYLDDFTPLADSDGYLPSSATWDGVHFVVARYAVWETVIRTHYA